MYFKAKEKSTNLLEILVPRESLSLCFSTSATWHEMQTADQRGPTRQRPRLPPRRDYARCKMGVRRLSLSLNGPFRPFTSSASMASAAAAAESPTVVTHYCTTRSVSGGSFPRFM